jgi:hypothetical protein
VKGYATDMTFSKASNQPQRYAELMISVSQWSRLDSCNCSSEMRYKSKALRMGYVGCSQGTTNRKLWDAGRYEHLRSVTVTTFVVVVIFHATFKHTAMTIRVIIVFVITVIMVDFLLFIII